MSVSPSATSAYTAPVIRPLRMAGMRMTGENTRDSEKGSMQAARHAPPASGSVRKPASGRHREYGLRLRELLRQDHLDVVVEHLRIGRRRALVLAVDEFGRAVGHD